MLFRTNTEVNLLRNVLCVRSAIIASNNIEILLVREREEKVEIENEQEGLWCKHGKTNNGKSCKIQRKGGEVSAGCCKDQ